MGKSLFRIGMVLLVSVVCMPQLFAKDLMVADFENGLNSNLGTPITTWTSNTLDYSQGTAIEIIKMYGVMDKPTAETHLLRLTYDVATTGPAFNGVSIKMPGVDLSPYDSLAFKIRGNLDTGFSTKFKVELKDSAGRRASALITGITADWQKVSIPMSAFSAQGAAVDWKNIIELRLAFDDITVDAKEGGYLVDEIKFVSKDPAK